MNTAWRWLILPACCVVAGMASVHWQPAPAPGGVYRDWPAVSDRKLERTFRSTLAPEERQALQDDTHRPVGRAGLRIDLAMSTAQLHYFRSARKDTPRRSEEVAIAFDGGPARTATAGVHGWSTQSTGRKSYAVQLFRRQQFTGQVRLRKFLLVNLLYDRGAFRMATCYRLLADMGLFPSYHELVTVFVNGHPEGVYLLVERVEDAVRRTEPDAIAVIRRRWNETAEVKFAGPGADLRAVQQLAAVDRPQGPDEPELAKAVDLDRYLKWLAFNSLVQNGDFGDEVFFYQTASPQPPHTPQPLRAIAWDYDDVFHPPAHPKQAFGDSILYACETHLDHRILTDPVLHARYANSLRALLTSLPPSRLQAALTAVHATLNAIDTGEPAPVQAASRAERESEVRRFERDLLARHAALCRHLDS